MLTVFPTVASVPFVVDYAWRRAGVSVALAAAAILAGAFAFWAVVALAALTMSRLRGSRYAVRTRVACPGCGGSIMVILTRCPDCQGGVPVGVEARPTFTYTVAGLAAFAGAAWLVLTGA